MKFLADENLPLSTVKSLQEKDIDIISIRNFGYGLEDKEVIRIAVRERRVLITLDKDFGEMVFRRAKKCRGIILLRVPLKSAEYLGEMLTNLLKRDIQFENNFTIVSVDRIRIVPLPK
jgi:predicted nuclease of predicted toxin-antitoxin system